MFFLTNPKEINNCFKEFYSDLYTTRSKATNSDFSKFFDSLKLPKLNEASTISLSELVEAIKASPSAKSVGPDGYGCKFKKSFQKFVDPLLPRLINDSMKNHKLPNTYLHSPEKMKGRYRSH